MVVQSFPEREGLTSMAQSSCFEQPRATASALIFHLQLETTDSAQGQSRHSR